MVDDVTGNIYVTVPNPNLKPERSPRYSAILEYFFEPAGTASIQMFETNLDNPIDNTPDAPGHPEYLRPRPIVCGSARYQWIKNLGLFVSGDRAYDSGKI